MASLGLEHRPFVFYFSVLSTWQGWQWLTATLNWPYNSSQEAANFPLWKINILSLLGQHFNLQIITQKIKIDTVQLEG